MPGTSNYSGDMAKKKESSELATREIEAAIQIIRGQRVMLDSDLAKLYGVPTSALNQAVKRNQARFPSDFAFVLTQQEFTDLISQTVISKTGQGGRTKRPLVFTEHGVAMLSSVLRSPTAVKVNIQIMQTFVKLRRLMATPGELVEQLIKLADTVKLHDDQIKIISQVLQQMLEKPVEPKRQIGFHVKNDKS